MGFHPFLLLLLSLLYASSFSDGANSNTSKAADLIDASFLTSKVPADPSRTIIVGRAENFFSIQSAIDAIPEGNSEWIIVHVRAGVYREKVTIPENKQYIFLRGSGKGRTSIVWNDSLRDNTEGAAFAVNADNFIAFGISFKNEAPELGEASVPFDQSVAAKVSGDKAAFYHCGFYSNHNTLFDHEGRHYYESCYIQGNIDFIFGHGQSIFQNCEIFVLPDRRTAILGSITAQNRQSPNETGGFVFIKCKVYGVGEVYLGRAKGAHSQVIFDQSYLSKTIAPAGWTDWSYDGTTENLLYGEHSCYGPGAETGKRIQWSRRLTGEEVASFSTIDFIDGKDWLPAYDD